MSGGKPPRRKPATSAVAETGAAGGPKAAPAGATRCSWAGEDPLYVRYHDEEWGVPVTDDRALFEKLVLEGFQAGLSWITILRKRAHFREVFDGFDPAAIARYDAGKVERLMADGGIVRNRLKIEATIDNARAFLALKDDMPLGRLVWELAGARPQQNRFASMAEVPAETETSRRISKALKARGFRFVGPTTVYAFMQSMGLVNDHLTTCPRHDACAAMATRFRMPGAR
ncbi:MAG: DNA-3-methyladenine glycosylase I [Hyphomicrobiaceae bacterium]